MVKTLMNTDRPVLEMDLDEPYIKVLDDEYLPFELKGFIRTTGEGDLKKSLRDLDMVKDFFASRTLSLSRDNAKVILNVTNLPQTPKMADKLKIVYACRALSMTDNYWLRDEGENIGFRDVNIRTNRLSDASYEIAVLGRHVTATADELKPDLSTRGMFPKYWHREDGTVYLYKTDRFTGNPNTKAEVLASRILEQAGANVVHYHAEERDGRAFSVCQCMADDDTSLLSIASARDWCDHNLVDESEILQNYKIEFANMVVADYVIANTDRNIENWGFMVDNATNSIKGFAPLFDLNQSLVADEFGTNIDDLIYEPTGSGFRASAAKYAVLSSLNFDDIDLTAKCRERWELVKRSR